MSFMISRFVRKRNIQQWMFLRRNSNNSQTKKIQVGLIGLGRIGRMHALNVIRNPKFELKWLVDDNEGACLATRDELKLDTPYYSPESLEDILNDRVDAVLVCTSTNAHTQISCQALKKGKAVFVEKPAGETMADVQRCFDAAEASGRPFLVGFNRRFDNTMREAHRQVASGDLGKIQFLRFTTRDSPKPSYDFLETCDSTGCNILSDLCVHDIDQLVWLTQSERPEHIYVTTHAHDTVMSQFGEADAIGVVIKYKNGAFASIDAFRESVYGYDIRMEIFGSNGVVFADSPHENETRSYNTTGMRQARMHWSFPQRFEQSFQSQLEHFANCLEGKCEPLITKKENLLTTEIIQKGLESFRLKQPVYF